MLRVQCRSVCVATVVLQHEEQSAANLVVASGGCAVPAHEDEADQEEPPRLASAM